MGILLEGCLCFIIFSKPTAFQRYFAASPSLWFDQGMLFRELEQWQSQKQTVFPMLMTTVGTNEQGEYIPSLIKELIKTISLKS